MTQHWIPDFPDTQAATPSVEQSMARIANAFDRMAAAKDKQVKIAQESLEIQRWMAQDSQKLRAEYEQGRE